MNLSIVIPVYNEEQVLQELLRRLVPVLQKLSGSYEIIFVNDGSTDNTKDQIINLSKDYPNLRLINLAKNYGHMEALSVGLKVSRGKFVISMDSDLQDPPELISAMLDLAESDETIEVVQAVRIDRKSDTVFKRFSADFFYKIARNLTGVKVIQHAADFRLMNRSSIELINSLPEQKKILRFLIPELGFKIKEIGFVRESRYTGTSKYGISKMFTLAVDSIISFSTKPLRLISISGFLLSLACGAGSILTFLVWLFFKTIPGWTSIILVILSSNALILSSLGMLGEYVAKIRISTLGRPNSKWTEITL